MWELDHKESWALKNWCIWIVVLERTLESPLDCKESKSVNPKGNQSWIFIGRTDAEAEVPILWPPDGRSRQVEKTWERLKAAEGDNRGWDGSMASPTGWTWVWASSRSWWWTGKPGVLQSIGCRVQHDSATKLNWAGFFSPQRAFKNQNSSPVNLIPNNRQRGKFWSKEVTAWGWNPTWSFCSADALRRTRAFPRCA